MRWIIALAVVAALAAPAAGASAAAGGGVERLQVECFAEYHLETGGWFGMIITPDAPVVGGPDQGPFTGGDGTAVFTPSGNMEANCHGEMVPPFTPFNGRGGCFAARGSDETRFYLGEGELVITPSGNVNLTCHASLAAGPSG
jgi:hypothetical protein